MASLLRQPGVRAFLLVWTGQIVSLLGSGLTAFALGVWIYQTSASTTQYALVTFCAAAPPLVVLPLAGPLIDRWDRKRLLVACELAGAAATAAVGALAWLGALSLAPACLIVAFTAAANAVQWPAWSATVTLLVPREHLGRASGMTQLAYAASQIVSPVLAGALIALIGLAGIAAIDLATFLFSTAALLAAAIPRSAPAAGPPRGYWRDLPVGWRFIQRHAGLTALLLMFAAVNFFTEMATLLFTPLVLNLSTPAALGMILAAGGFGMVAGGALLSVWGGGRRPALGAALYAGLCGAVVAAAGLTVSIPLLAAAAFAFYFFMPLLAGSSQVVWQRAVPAELQGRVFSARATVAMSAVPVASLAAGPLADRVFEPAMAAGTPLATLAGPVVRAGPGRGIALLILSAGLLSVLAAGAAALYAPLRRLDDVSLPTPLPAPAGARS